MVPIEFVGLWRRRSLVCGGKKDDTTQVFYLQTIHKLFADIRIPQYVVSEQSSRDERLLFRSKMKGFGGTFDCDMTTQICKWNRELDYQPVPPPIEYLPDESNFRFEGNLLIETGIHEEFEEVWERVTPVGVKSFAFRQAERDGSGILVVTGNYFICIFKRDVVLPEASSLEVLVQQAIDRNDQSTALQYLDMIIEFGEVTDSENRNWIVALSTSESHLGKPSTCLTKRWQEISQDTSEGSDVAVSWKQTLNL